ncbi:hypothetical protein EDB84DRAFT_1583037 [Lactarius hengduanensis]|nr:hypothetical protein EDB84DRAFT_1583037 [Lactarius hengduanensis]
MCAARARGTEAEHELTEMLVFGREQRLQCTAYAGVSYRVDPHDLLSVPVLARETGKDAEGRATYEEAPLTRRDVRATRQAHKNLVSFFGLMMRVK